MKKSKIEKIVSIFLLCGLFFTLALFYSLLFIPQKDISIEENRTLQKVPVFSLNEFISGDFQEKMENSIGDQLQFSIEIKYGVKQFYNGLTSLLSSIPVYQTPVVSITQTPQQTEVPSAQEERNIEEPLEQEIPQPDKNSYIYKEVVAGKLYKLDDSGYIVKKPRPPEDYSFDLYDPKMLAAITKPKYLFYIQNTSSADFNDIKKYDTFNYIKNHIPMTGYDMLYYNSFDEYKKMFYQTDHHWNYYGSYIGYSKIIKMLEGDDVELRKPVRTHTYDTIYNGSLARDNLLRCATEKFTVYEYDLPPYKTYVNDVEKEYGYRSLYVSDSDFPNKTYANHYGMYYGDDWAKVVYDFNQPEKENLLILGTSYTNAVNELISSHYNKTYILDYRYYKKQYGEPINAQKFMEDHNISKVVIIGSITSLGYLK